MKVILLWVLVLLGVQVVSYLALSSFRIPSLALRSTPENTHFRGTKFSWVLLHIEESEESKGLSRAQRERMLSLFRSRYAQVYTDEAAIPAALISRDTSGRFTGYDRGFEYNFSLVSRGPFWLRVGHGDYEGDEAASSGKHLYVWLLGFWIKIYDGPMVAS